MNGEYEILVNTFSGHYDELSSQKRGPVRLRDHVQALAERGEFEHGKHHFTSSVQEAAQEFLGDADSEPGLWEALGSFLADKIGEGAEFLP